MKKLMKKLGSCVAAISFAFIFAHSVRSQSESKPILRLDPALDELVSPEAKLELVKSGFGFTEGITYVPQGKSGYLIFSDMPANVIYKMTLDGNAVILEDHSGYTKPDVWDAGMDQTNGKDPNDPAFRRFFIYGSNGLALDREGRILVATWGGRSIERIEKNGKRTTLADRYDGKRFDGPNDIVVKKDGAIYFTDSVGGMRGRDKDPTREMDLQGIYMIKDGKVSLVIKDIPTPNGLAFSPDEKYLYANGSAGRYVRRYTVQPDDTLSDSQMFFDMSSDKTPGITDGMKVDTKGNVWESGPGGIWILSPDAKHLGTIPSPELVANLCFGDADNKTLYVAARTSIYKMRVNLPGIR
jgi:gluconolactonase